MCNGATMCEASEHGKCNADVCPAVGCEANKIFVLFLLLSFDVFDCCAPRQPLGSSKYFPPSCNFSYDPTLNPTPDRRYDIGGVWRPLAESESFRYVMSSGKTA
jgi:hypothetical protein